MPERYEPVSCGLCLPPSPALTPPDRHMRYEQFLAVGSPLRLPAGEPGMSCRAQGGPYALAATPAIRPVPHGTGRISGGSVCLVEPDPVSTKLMADRSLELVQQLVDLDVHA